MKVISEFKNEYAWLSNFWMIDVEYEGRVWPSAEHAYQSAKSKDLFYKSSIAVAATPGRAKALGRGATLRPDWEELKVSVMQEILREKFRPRAGRDDLSEKLVGTEYAVLIEGNRWGDTFWGISGGKGRNELGRLIMEVRSEIVNGHLRRKI